MNQQQAVEKAETIVTRWRFPWPMHGHLTMKERDPLIDAIAAALVEAATVEPGHVRDATGGTWQIIWTARDPEINSSLWAVRQVAAKEAEHE